MVPGEKPGLRIPPEATETFPVMVPVPASVPPLMFNCVLDVMPPPLSAVDPEVCVYTLVKFSVPAFALTVPVLLNATLTVLVTPPVICNVPALLNVGVPPLKMMPFPFPLLPFTKVHTAPTRLLITAPFCRTRLAPTAVLPKVVAPETLSVRVSRSTCPEGRLIPPLALVAPVPVMFPPVQVSSPLTVTVEVPVKMPAEKVSADVVTAPPMLLKLAVPPLMVSAPALVNVPVKFAVPPLTVVPPGIL